MRPELEELLRRKSRRVLLTADGEDALTEELWDRAAEETQRIIAALLPDCRWDCQASEEAIQALALRLYLDFTGD